MTEQKLPHEQKRATYGRAQTLTLPSGIKVRARRPSILSLINAGGFPSELTVEVWKLIKKDMLDPDKVAGDAEGIKTWAQILDLYVPYVLIDPRIMTAPDAPTELFEADANGLVTGQLNIRDVTDMDKQIIFLFGNDACASDEELKERGVGSGIPDLAAALRRFRRGPERVEAGRGGEAVRAEAVELAGAAAAEPAVP